MVITPNLFAYFALLAWVPITIALFLQMRPPLAAAASLLGASLLLPVRLAFDVPGAPPIDRDVIATLAIALGCAFVARGAFSLRHGLVGPELLIVPLLVAPFLSALANPDALVYGPRTIPGNTLWDGGSLAFRAFVTVAMPFVLGRGLVRSPADVRGVLRLMAVFALVYSVLILWELRMSPNLHRIVYGYHPHSFAQHARYGGWRPMVFASHGLALALYVATAATASFGLARARQRLYGQSYLLAGGYLLAVLVAMKSLAATVYGVLMFPLTYLAGLRTQLRIALAVAFIVLGYPLLRTYDWFPKEGLLELSGAVEAERADSLAYRFENEDRLLEKVRARAWFGWGGWGRNRVYNPLSGHEQSVTDGYWIILLGTQGVVGFVSCFLLLLTPIAMAWRRVARFATDEDRVTLSTLALILVVLATDLIPNSLLSSLHLFLAGGLVGALRQRVTAPARAGAPARAPAGPPPPPIRSPLLSGRRPRPWSDEEPSGGLPRG